MLSDKQIADVLRGLPPDADDKTVVGAMRSAESGTPLEHIWAAVNKPLAGSADALVPALRHEHGPDEGGLRRTAEDFGASLTSPLSLATTAAGVGAGIAGKAGKFGISNAARGVEAALQAPLAAEGLHNVVEADSSGQALAGAAESALALHGMGKAANHAFDPKAVKSAFMKERGLSARTPEPFSETAAMRTAEDYTAMKHTPDDPAVVKSYDALKSQIDDQHKFLAERAGVKLEPWTGSGEPYPGGAKEMQADVVKNNRLYYLQTDKRILDSDIPNDHPMVREDAGQMVPNDKFRVVHDYMGHAADEKPSFGPVGEQRAFNSHRDTLTDEAIPALATETKGQNSFVNFGEHLRDPKTGLVPQKGRPGYVSPQERPFAPQKAGLLPEFQQGQTPLLQGEELARYGSVADTPTSTPRTGASPSIGTADASQSSVELSPELGEMVNSLHEQHGGSTFNLAQKRNLVGEPFYAISAFPDRGEILDRQPTPQDFNRFIHKNLDLLQKPEHSIGTWFNPEDQKHYLDVSITEPDRAKAMALGKQHNQLAVFDLKNLDTIPIEGTTGKPIEGATAKPIEGATSLASPLAAVKQGAKLLDQGVSPADLKPALLKAGAPPVSIDKIVAAARKLHLQHAVSR